MGNFHYNITLISLLKSYWFYFCVGEFITQMAISGENAKNFNIYSSRQIKRPNVYDSPTHWANDLKNTMSKYEAWMPSDLEFHIRHEFPRPTGCGQPPALLCKGSGIQACFPLSETLVLHSSYMTEKTLNPRKKITIPVSYTYVKDTVLYYTVWKWNYKRQTDGQALSTV